jgi:hypothetical protein
VLTSCPQAWHYHQSQPLSKMFTEALKSTRCAIHLSGTETKRDRGFGWFILCISKQYYFFIRMYLCLTWFFFFVLESFIAECLIQVT